MPLPIEDDETLTRAILSPYHVKNGKLLRGAFEAPYGNDEVSVSRGRYVADWIAVLYARRRVQQPKAKTPKLYEGLAYITADGVRRLGAQVDDSRREYLGHADISHGVVRIRGQAMDPQKKRDLDTRLDKMAKLAKYAPKPPSVR